MLSRKEEKLIRSLKQKKFRYRDRLFLIEGEKLLGEAIRSNVKPELILYTEEVELELGNFQEENLRLLDSKRMKELSNLSTPPGILAVVKMPESDLQPSTVTLYFDEISDPGNLGTIIRTADAMGVKQLLLSPNSTDPYAPKTVQASMGSIFRLKIAERSIAELEALRAGADFHFFAADMEGENLYETDLKSPAILIMGSESHGLSPEIAQLEATKLSIPMKSSVESLNVGVSTAIILSEFSRRKLI